VNGGAWWLTIAMGVLTLLGGGGGLYALLTLGATRRKILAEATSIKAGADETVADAAKVLIGGAADLVEPLKRELREVRVELAAVRREADMLERKAGHLDRTLTRLAAMIHDPYMSMDRLRAMVPEGSGGNGASRGAG